MPLKNPACRQPKILPDPGGGDGGGDYGGGGCGGGGSLVNDDYAS